MEDGIREIIIEEAKTPPLKTCSLIDECLKDGVIYEPMRGYYRLTFG